MPRLACATPAHAPHALKPEEVGLTTAAAALLDQAAAPDPVAPAPPVPAQPPALPPALPATSPASVPTHLQLSGAVPAPPLAAASSVTREALPTFSASASARPRCPKVVRTLEDMFSWASDFIDISIDLTRNHDIGKTIIHKLRSAMRTSASLV